MNITPFPASSQRGKEASPKIQITPSGNLRFMIILYIVKKITYGMQVRMRCMLHCSFNINTTSRYA
jgi:hypothetical protein